MNVWDALAPFERPITQRHRYPGLREMDTAILDLHCKLCGFAPDRWWFDVPVGPIEASIATHPFILKYPHMLRNYTNRIDLIFLVGGVWTVAELKPLASYVALGQALLYAHLLQEEYPEVEPVRRLIMTDSPYQPSISLCGHLGVHIAELPPGTITPYPRPMVPTSQPTDPFAAAVGAEPDAKPPATALEEGRIT